MTGPTADVAAISGADPRPDKRPAKLFSNLHSALWLVLHPEWIRGVPDRAVRIGKYEGNNTDRAVVLFVGVRVNALRRVGVWLPLLLSMPRMLRQLVDDPESGLVGYRLLIGPGIRQAMLVQYWTDPGLLFAFAADGATHGAAQSRYRTHYAGSDGAVGVWHEVLIADAHAHQSLYGNMPPTGIGGLRGTRASSWRTKG